MHQNFFNIKINKIVFIDDIVLKNSTKKTFVSFVCNESIKKISQIGKFIIVHLSSNKIIEIHLRLEGKIFYLAKNKISKFPMVEFYLDNGKKIVYDDSRKFGTINIYNNYQDLLSSDEIKKLGKQPFDQTLTANYLFNCFKNKTQKIKTTLLDQTIVAGIGNIYADETLFLCEISPFRQTNKVSLKECQLIIDNCRKIMTKSIKNRGTTAFSYQYALNHSGSFQKYLKVYGRKNLPCLRCGSILY
jgi:formamidopyrimidine-DNA glycosylase